MNQHQDKLLAKLHRQIQSQNFSSEKELEQFLETLVGKKLDDLVEEEDLDPKAQAQEMVYEAFEAGTEEATRMMLELALVTDPDCIAAYEGLAELEESLYISNAIYEKGIVLGRAEFGGTYLEEHKGEFWVWHETRPFMRCMHGSADCLYEMGKTAEAIALLEELLELNPNDNQGVRDQLMLYLMEAGEYERYRKYNDQYSEDSSAFALFNRALAAYKTGGESDAADTLLREAGTGNAHVAKRLLARKPIEETPDAYSYGSEEEADYYAYHAWQVWQQTEGATDWLKKAVKPAAGRKRKK